MQKENTEGTIQKGKLRKATEDFIPDLPKATVMGNLDSGVMLFADILKEWNQSYGNDVMAVGQHTFKADFARLSNYKNAEEVRKKFEPLSQINSQNIKPKDFEKAIFVLIRVSAYDDLHKVTGPFNKGNKVRSMGNEQRRERET